MTPQIAELMEKIRFLQGELDVELAKRRAELRVGIEHGRIKPLVILTAPVIYAGIIPFLVLDLFVTVYQAVCFPIYGIARVRRTDYLVFDRHHLAYLNALEKLNCAYCAYANGLIAYTREIAARTEQYWCPIKHARRVIGTHDRYVLFGDFGDAEEYQEQLARLRKALVKDV